MDSKSRKNIIIMGVAITVLTAAFLQDAFKDSAQEVSVPNVAMATSPEELFPDSAPIQDNVVFLLSEESAKLSVTRDPFKRVVFEETGPPPLILEGIFRDRDGFGAMINGEIVAIGQIINGHVIVSIEAVRVVLTNGDETVILKLPD